MEDIKKTISDLFDESLDSNFTFLEEKKNVDEKLSSHLLKYNELNEELERRLSDMRNSRESELKRQLEAIDESLRIAEENSKSLKSEHESLQERLESLDEEFSSSERRLLEARTKLNTEKDLMMNLFKIKWDLTAPENKVKGYVLNPSTNELHPFEFDTETNSQFFITECLWDFYKGSSITPS